MYVRPAVVTDIPAVAEVHVRSWQEAYVGHVPQDYLDGLSIDDRTRRWQETVVDAEWPNPDLLVLLDDDDVVVGFAATSASRDNDAAVTTGEVPACPQFERQPTLMRHHGLVTADEILAAWESKWGTLPSRMRQRFLGRAELQELTQLSSSDVTRAIRTRGPKLTAILLGATYEVRRREQLRQAGQRDSQEREERRRAAQEGTPPRGSDRWSPPVPPGTIARSGY